MTKVVKNDKILILLTFQDVKISEWRHHTFHEKYINPNKLLAHLCKRK